MNTSDHGRRPLARAGFAVAGLAAVLAVAVAADLAGYRYGVTAGAAVIVAVFAACWLVHRARPMLHPVPLARRSGTRDPEVTAETPALAGTAASG